jgi:ribonuclease III
VDVVLGRAVGADRGRFLTAIAPWIAEAFGHAPVDLVAFERALTHGSKSDVNYERLEFLGDRVLGLVIAEWVFEVFPNEREGQLASRVASLVSRATCADVARSAGVAQHLRLGKQARDAGAFDSDNVLGDVMEALIGALFREAGLDAARTAIRTLWTDHLDQRSSAPKHPKAELQEWAAANNRKPPEYVVEDRSGPDHAPHFTVRVMLGTFASAVAEGGSKHEAETAAAKALLAELASAPRASKSKKIRS